MVSHCLTIRAILSTISFGQPPSQPGDYTGTEVCGWELLFRQENDEILQVALLMSSGRSVADDATRTIEEISSRKPIDS